MINHLKSETRKTSDTLKPSLQPLSYARKQPPDEYAVKLGLMGEAASFPVDSPSSQAASL